MKKPLLNYSKISKQLSSSTIVGIGESTHGTHEFFETKVEIFKELISNYGFSTIFFEAMDDNCEAINKYIQFGDGNPEELVGKLYCVYRVKEVLKLVVWLRQHSKTHPINFIGLDERQRLKSYLPYNIHKANLRDRNMASVIKVYLQNNPDAKALIWAHDRHISSDEEPLEEFPEISYKSMGWSLRKWFGNKYYNIALLFGNGYFNAALMEETGKLDNELIIEHYAPLPPSNFWEARLFKKINKPIFIESSNLKELFRVDKKLYQRELGYHLKKSEVHSGNNIAPVDITNTYKAVIFFPQATASRLLG
jgi:erythromycin esterase-like protein